MDELIYKSTTEIARLIREKRVSSEEVVKACLDRIEAVNPDLNAVVQVTVEQAVDAARLADKALSRGDNIGKLHGVPMTIKDSLDTTGVVSTGGTLGRKDYIPNKDATVVSRLKAEGAILLGKTNTPELTLAFETNNLVYGRTNNPYNLERSSGGSSGGAAAIVASGGAYFDIGSDYAGSIRLPSAFCGVAGIRPTSGRVPRTGHILDYAIGATESFQTLGPIARTVADLKLILPIIAGTDFQDPAIVDIPLNNPDAVDLSNLRVGFFTDNGTVTPIPEIISAVKDVAQALKSHVQNVTESRPPRTEETWEVFFNIANADGRLAVQNVLKKFGTTETSENIRPVADEDIASGEEFGRRLREFDIFRSDVLGWMKDFDVVICPVNANVAIPHDTWVDYMAGFSYTAFFNLTGYPGAVVRVGTSDDGLPVAVQIVAAPWHEEIALAVAEFVEGAFGGWQAPETDFSKGS